MVNPWARPTERRNHRAASVAEAIGPMLVTPPAMPMPKRRPSCHNSVARDMAARQAAVRIVPTHMIVRIERRSSSGPTKRPESVMATMKTEAPRETCAFVASNASAIGTRKMGNDAIEVPMQTAWVAKPTPTMRQP